MIIGAYYVNYKEFCTCNSKGVPNIKPVSTKRRTLEEGENELEKNYLREIDDAGFNPDKSCVNSWIMANFKVKKANHSLVESISKFFSGFLDIHLPREAYRRRTCCIYWLENNIDKVFQACRSFHISCKLVSGKIIELRPFRQVYKRVNRPIAAPVPKKKPEKECESIFDNIDFSIDFNQDDFYIFSTQDPADI